ncbi:hypothetical protein Glove_78g115 [Diversispora epigaea]|uniref:Uncharacterized protein n=1 Tax=Diversispora epigaea TaxID=1348612 RepID=A0A397JHI9_9GLOM|nr:hypothetical protein Glove_78g115 [Diversispora epigaea]
MSKKNGIKMITKCISKTNDRIVEMDSEYKQLKHRIPHHFEEVTNIATNWCFHCGYMLPLGKRSAKRCTGTYDHREMNPSRTKLRHANSSHELNGCKIQDHRYSRLPPIPMQQYDYQGNGTKKICNQYSRIPAITLSIQLKQFSQGMIPNFPTQKMQIALSSNPVVPSDNSFIKNTRIC